MARGSTAKVRITERIQAAFGDDFIGVQDGKIYVWENDGGEKVQIAIALTCPKTGIGAVSAPADFPDTGVTVTLSSDNVEKSEAEMDAIAAMMKRLGL